MDLEDTAPCVQHDEHWIREGAKPKRPPTSSTPLLWTLAGRGKRGGKLISHVGLHQSTAPLATYNPFSVLDEDFPCLLGSKEVPACPQSTITPTSASAQFSSSKIKERRQLIRSAV